MRKYRTPKIVPPDFRSHGGRPLYTSLNLRSVGPRKQLGALRAHGEHPLVSILRKLYDYRDRFPKRARVDPPRVRNRDRPGADHAALPVSYGMGPGVVRVVAGGTWNVDCCHFAFLPFPFTNDQRHFS